MAENATSSGYVVPDEIGSPLVAVVVDGEIKLVDCQTAEDMDDLAAIQAAKKSGPLTSYSEFRKELGLT